MADKVEGVACIQAGQEDETTPTLEWMRGRGRRRRIIPGWWVHGLCAIYGMRHALISMAYQKCAWGHYARNYTRMMRAKILQ